ncbi:tRNA lysidine(34) synthetase TilS [Robiginitalea sp. M366]|uniref:tRNA lysidine(34) synthetase TilS n=1 Tax=Robiginitalea aestuariiviva TaxID=3036903 RepID=UPI00240DC67D|nr:tRNA lysidine(34) synthetase TilS [Robiginitalea aestuariiviva]MDG1572824.1 tRNA lysidine(34) synthetase TilS [Robiginitalea aestuariiviva]
MEAAFKAHLETHFPEILLQPVLLACSGGLDSVVLAHLCARLGVQATLAHCNFQLRGGESDGDQHFVEVLGKSLGIPVVCKTFQTREYLEEHGLSVQEGARELRYAWFETLLDAGRANFVLTAHHANDQLETFLIHLGRGTGLDGLCGIPARNGRVLRPLLLFTRERLEAYAQASGLTWREDKTNAELEYLRNRYRHLVIPGLKAVVPEFPERFQTTLTHLQGSRALVERYAGQLRESLFREQEDGTHVLIKGLLELEPLQPHLYALFQPYGFSDWPALERLLYGPAGKEVRSHTHRMLRGRESLILRLLEPKEKGVYEVDPEGGGTGLPLSLRFENVSELGPTGPGILYADRDALKQGLRLRKWKKGDYFYPLGLGGRKTISKYFRDARQSRFRKEDAWLLCSGEDVVWIIGHRADDRFKVTESTQNIWKITCEAYE